MLQDTTPVVGVSVAPCGLFLFNKEMSLIVLLTRDPIKGYC